METPQNWYFTGIYKTDISEKGSRTHDPQMARMAILRFRAPYMVADIFGYKGRISGSGIGGQTPVKWGHFGVIHGVEVLRTSGSGVGPDPEYGCPGVDITRLK